MTEVLRRSTVWNEATIDDIHAKAELGRYRIRGFSQLRERPLPSFDDLTFLLCTLTRIPLEGYREKCNTQTVLGTRFATRPIINDIPVMISGMSFGALSYNAKVALARGAAAAGSSTTTGDGGMLAAERDHARTLIYEVLPSRYGFNVHHLLAADAIELTVGQGQARHWRALARLQSLRRHCPATRPAPGRGSTLASPPSGLAGSGRFNY